MCCTFVGITFCACDCVKNVYCPPPLPSPLSGRTWWLFSFSLYITKGKCILHTNKAIPRLRCVHTRILHVPMVMCDLALRCSACRYLPRMLADRGLSYSHMLLPPQLLLASWPPPAALAYGIYHCHGRAGVGVGVGVAVAVAAFESFICAWAIDNGQCTMHLLMFFCFFFLWAVLILCWQMHFNMVT